MVKIDSVHVKNYCGYSDCFFDFLNADGSRKDFTLLYGPNGIGKSTLLEAIRLTGNHFQFRGRERESDISLRKSIYDNDFIPGVDPILMKQKKEMLIETVFSTPEGKRRVVIDNKGIANHLDADFLPYKHGGYAFYCDADHPINTQKFGLLDSCTDTFLGLCREVYGYHCEMSGEPVPDMMQGPDGEMVKVAFWTDFVIKKGDVRVHFKRMSAGEKKIATMLSHLVEPTNTGERDIVLIDNVEMHIYWKRHPRTIDRLRDLFPNKQLVTTTHSSLVIKHVEPNLHFDLEQYRPEYRLLDDHEKGEGDAGNE
jgi:hypothetical protein